MEIKDGFLRDDMGSKSMGRLLALVLVGAAVVSGVLGIILKAEPTMIIGLVSAMIAGAAGLKVAQKFAEKEK